MTNTNKMERDPLYVVSPSIISHKSRLTGLILVRSTFILMLVMLIMVVEVILICTVCLLHPLVMLVVHL